MLIICSWRPWQKVHKKVSQLLDLLLTFCLNLSNLSKPTKHQNNPHKALQRKTQEGHCKSCHPTNEWQAGSWGDPVGFLWEAGLEAVLCHTAVRAQGLQSLWGSWNSHVPNAPFAVPVAQSKAMSCVPVLALAQPVLHEPSKTGQEQFGATLCLDPSALQKSLTRTPAKIWFGTFLKV